VTNEGELAQWGRTRGNPEDASRPWLKKNEGDGGWGGGIKHREKKIISMKSGPAKGVGRGGKRKGGQVSGNRRTQGGGKTLGTSWVVVGNDWVIKWLRRSREGKKYRQAGKGQGGGWWGQKVYDVQKNLGAPRPMITKSEGKQSGKRPPGKAGTSEECCVSFK